MIPLLQELIAIPSFSREEGAAADLLQERLAEQGLPMHRTGNNLWCSTEGEGPVILLNAHIDTVRPAAGYTRDPFRPSLEGDRLYGLGANDDGGSVVAMIRAYRILSSRPQPYRLVLSLTAEEEVTGTGGIEMLFPLIGPVSLGIIGEPTGLRMAVAERGLMVLDCTAHGVSGHAARDEGKNAIYAAMEDIRRLLSFDFGRPSDLLGRVKTTVTMIQAGTQHNVIPDTCSFVVDVRTNEHVTNQEVLLGISRCLQSDVRARSTLLGSSGIAPDHPAVLRGLGLGLEPFGSPTLSNSAVCPFPTLKIGPGDSARSHGPDEYICLSEIEEAVNVYVKLLDGLEI